MFDTKRFYVVVDGDEAAARAAIAYLIEGEWIEPIKSIGSLFEGRQTSLGIDTFFPNYTEKILNSLMGERKISWWTTQPKVPA